MKRIATLILAMAAAIASLTAFAQTRGTQPPSWMGRLYGVPGPKVNFGSCQAPVPAVLLSPSSLDFGTVASPNASPSQTITVRNVGNNVLQIFSINAIPSTDEANLYVITNNTCPPTLAPLASCAVDIAFDASADPGNFGATPGSLQVFTNAPSSVAMASLTATEIAQPVPQFSFLPAGGLDFGSVPQSTTSSPLTVTIQNVGNAPMPTVLVSTDNSDFQVASTNCGVIPAGGSCTAQVTFAPTVTGFESAQLVYEYTHPIFGLFFESAPLQGTGLSATADISVSPSSIDFGTITVASAWGSGVDVTNVGATPLVINSATIPASFTIFSNTCPIGAPGLAPGAVCNIAFSPDTSAPGTISSTLTIDSNSSTTPTFDVPITAFVIPDFTIVPSFYDFGNVFVNPAPVPTVTVTLTNNDPIPEPISFSSQIFGTNFTVGPGGPSPCPATLSPGQTCTFVIGFAPQSPGGYFGPTIAIQDGASTTWYDFSAIGTGIPSGPAATFTPSFLDFGTQPIGGPPVTQTVDFTNTGNQPLTVASYTFNAPYTATPVIGFCPPAYPVIAQGESCRLSVTFTPPASISSFFDSGIVNDATGGNVGSVQLFAFTSGLPTAAGDFYPPSLNFGNIGVNKLSSPMIVSFGNTGALPFNITSTPTVTGPFLLASACPTTLAPGDCCSLTITYAPPPPGGPDAGTISIPTDVGGSFTFNVALAGVGVPPPSISVAPIVLPVTRQGFVTGPVPYAITNVGVTPITLTGIALAAPAAITGYDPAIIPPPASPFGACIGAALPVGASCVVNFWFAPVAVANLNGTFTVTYTTGTASPAVIPVLAAGVPPTFPDIALSADILDFNGVVLNTSGTTRLVVTSSGTGPLQITGITPLGAGFTQANNCNADLDPGTSCVIDVSFRPDALRDYTGDLVIEFQPDGNFRIVKLKGTGINVPKPRISLSATSLAFNPLRVGTRSSDQSVIVSNVGTAPLAIAGVSTSPGYLFINGCGTLAPGASCTVLVRFAPLGVGREGASLAITSNDPDRPTATVNLTGTGCRTMTPSTARNVATPCTP